jgi:DNA-directed RNA polymerase subunit M/transcription elongation factor TFIIS
MSSENEWKCPECGNTKSWQIKKTRLPYQYQDGSNPMACECLSCGHKWEERH